MTEVKLVDLDYAILDTLAEDGTKLGFTLIAKQAAGIVRDLNAQLPIDAPKEARVTSASINGRLRTLKLGGYVVDHTVQPVGKGQGWQRTPKGTRLLAEHSTTTVEQPPPIAPPGFAPTVATPTPTHGQED